MKKLAPTAIAVSSGVFFLVLAFNETGGSDNNSRSAISSGRTEMPVDQSATMQVARAHPEPRKALDAAHVEPTTVSATVTDAPSAGLVDASGLSHDAKIEQIITVYDAYQRAHTGVDAKDQTTAEFWLAVRCAISVLREQNEAQYSLDVDEGAKRGFALPAPSADTITIAADCAKYTISSTRFPAVALARERREIARDSNRILHRLTEAEREIYEACVRDALTSLGVSEARD